MKVCLAIVILIAGSVSLLAQGFGQPQTEQEKKNIAVVMGFWREVWEGRDGKAVPKYLAESYVEHNNGGANGRENMAKIFGGPIPPGFPRMEVTSQTAYARGEFVLLTQEREIADPADAKKTRTIIIVEMFRVYDGLLQEHWMFFATGQ